jgi:hypothetical protein
MSSGAFALYIDQNVGGGGNARIRRVIPLPPTSGGDAINFSQGRLSLAYDDFDSDAMASVRVRIINNEGIRVDQELQFGRGVAGRLGARLSTIGSSDRPRLTGSEHISGRLT